MFGFFLVTLAQITTMILLSSQTYESLKEKLNHPKLKIAAPGRINLIGEHIDYNGGNVLPAAIDKRIIFSFKKNETSDTAFILSENFKEGFQINLKNIQKNKGWINYFAGILALLQKKTAYKITGFDCLVESNLPVGGGVSSSAALLCGFAKGLNMLFDLGIEDINLIKLCQRAEQIFSGANVGVMDQFAVTMGKKDHLLFLDCDTLQYKAIYANFSPYILLLLNTNVTHSLGDSAYNTRREECEQALKIIQNKYPHIKNLAGATLEMVADLENTFPKNVRQRAVFVIEEQQRVLKTIEALKDKDFVKVGQLLNDSHRGLQNLYQVSCENLDFLAAFAKKDSRILGGRMMGGGFGGCTLNLVHKDHVDRVIKEIGSAYKEKFNRDMTPMVAHISDGVQKI